MQHSTPLHLTGFFFLWPCDPTRVMASSFLRFLDHTQRHTTVGGTPLPDNTQHSQQTYMHTPGGIRTHDLSRRAAADLLLRPRGHWELRSKYNCPFLCSRIKWIVISSSVQIVCHRVGRSHLFIYYLFVHYFLRSYDFWAFSIMKKAWNNATIRLLNLLQCSDESEGGS